MRDDFAHDPHERANLHRRLKRFRTESFHQKFPLKINTRFLIFFEQRHAHIKQVTNQSIQPQINHLLRFKHFPFNPVCAPARFDIFAPMICIKPRQPELHDHARDCGEHDRQPQPRVNRNKRPNCKYKRKRMRHDICQTRKNIWKKLRKLFGALVHIDRVFVVVVPKFNRAKALVHYVGHSGFDTKPHKLARVALENTPRRHQHAR